jgi:hypothetical protein
MTQEIGRPEEEIKTSQMHQDLLRSRRPLPKDRVQMNFMRNLRA